MSEVGPSIWLGSSPSPAASPWVEAEPQAPRDSADPPPAPAAVLAWLTTWRQWPGLAGVVRRRKQAAAVASTRQRPTDSSRPRESRPPAVAPIAPEQLPSARQRMPEPLVGSVAAWSGTTQEPPAPEPHWAAAPVAGPLRPPTAALRAADSLPAAARAARFDSPAKKEPRPLPTGFPAVGKAARLAVQPPAAAGQGRLSAVGSTTRQRSLVGNPLERRKLAALAGMAALGRSGRGPLAGEEGRAPNLAREPRSACAPTDPPPGNWLEEALARRGLPGSSRELQALVSRLSRSVATEAVEQAL